MLEPYKVVATKPAINVLVYGNPGVGKTSFAATAQDHPDMRDVLFLNVEGGLLSVAKRQDISAIDIRGAKDLEEVFWAFRDVDSKLSKFHTVALDSGTELQTLNLEEIVRSQMEKKGGSRSINDVYLEDYGTSTNVLRRLFRWFKDLNINFIVTALIKENYEQVNNKRVPSGFGPSLTDKLAMALQGYMDFVWYLYKTDDDARHLLVDNRNSYEAKTRGANFRKALVKSTGEPIVDNPYLPDLYDLLVKTEGPDFPHTDTNFNEERE